MSQLTEADRDTLRWMTEEEWGEAALASEWDRTLALCSGDIDYMQPDGPALRGHEELRAFLEGFPTIVAFSQSVQRIEGSGDQAVLRGTFALTVEAEEGETTGEGKFLATAAKIGDDWKFATVCFNWDAPFG